MKKPSANIANLNKVQKFFIKHHRTRNPKTLCTDVDASVTLVKAYLKYLDRLDIKHAEADAAAAAKAEKLAKENPPPPSTGVAQIKAGDFFGRNKKRGVTVMTPEASQLGDASRSHMSPRLAKNVYKIRPE